jgi:sortase B
MKNKETINLMIANLALIIIICGGLIFQYISVGIQSNQQFEQIADTFYTEDEGLPGFDELQAQNADMVAWIKIEGTRIDYPVMHTPNDSQYYIKRDFNKDYSASGTPFVDYRNTFAPRSDNIIIYGHHMNNGSMFSDLLKYENVSYFQERQLIDFYTEDGHQQYQIIAAFYSQILMVDEAGFRYYNFIDSANASDFDNYIANAKSRTPYDIDQSTNFGDELLTLSTCSYHTDEGRFVLVAKKLD